MSRINQSQIHIPNPKSRWRVSRFLALAILLFSANIICVILIKTEKSSLQPPSPCASPYDTRCFTRSCHAIPMPCPLAVNTSGVSYLFTRAPSCEESLVAGDGGVEADFGDSVGSSDVGGVRSRLRLLLDNGGGSSDGVAVRVMRGFSPPVDLRAVCLVRAIIRSLG